MSQETRNRRGRTGIDGCMSLDRGGGQDFGANDKLLCDPASVGSVRAGSSQWECDGDENGSREGLTGLERVDRDKQVRSITHRHSGIFCHLPPHPISTT